MELLNRRVLITGGAGLIGSHIADVLVREQPAEIVALDNFSRGRRSNLRWAQVHGPVTVVEGDIRDRKLVAEVMRGIDVLFHQAAIRITRCAEEPRLAFEVLVDGTFNVVEAAAQAGVKRVIAASSASVYGMAEKFPTMETHHPYHNRALYGAAKTFNEGLLRSFHDMYGLDYVALRYFNVYGPRMDIHGAHTEVLVRWMEQIASGRPPVIFGDGRQTMDLVYVDDVARANLLTAKSNVSDEVFNVGTGVETSLTDLATKLRDVTGSDIGVEYCPERKTASIRKRQADVSSARDRLGFEPLVSLEEGLRRLVEWWRKEREGHEKPPV
jgi:UDP-glucose 4-epimerase